MKDVIEIFVLLYFSNKLQKEKNLQSMIHDDAFQVY